MDAITKYFSDYVKKNPQILKNYESGFLTIQEAGKLIFQAIEEENEADAIFQYLTNENIYKSEVTRKEKAKIILRTYGSAAEAIKELETLRN